MGLSEQQIKQIVEETVRNIGTGTAGAACSGSWMCDDANDAVAVS